MVTATSSARKHFALILRASFAAAAVTGIAIDIRRSLSISKPSTDTDHVTAVYKQRGHWGAIAKSNYAGCRYREPVYRTLRELAMSYFEVYFNLRRERTLRTFSNPVNLARFDRHDWMTTDQHLWFIAECLFTIRHFPLLPPKMAKRLHRLRRSLIFAPDVWGGRRRISASPVTHSELQLH